MQKYYFYHIDKLIIKQEEQGKSRVNYGDFLSRYLSDTIGKGFSEANLKNIRQFYVIFPDFDQLATHCAANLTWTNIRMIMRLDSKDERAYYLKELSEQNWSSRSLERHIKTGYYRRLLSTQQKENSPATSNSDKYYPISILSRMGHSFINRILQITVNDRTSPLKSRRGRYLSI